MFLLVAIVWALFGPDFVFSITVSPNYGLRNTTTTEIFEGIVINKTLETNESMIDRNRRLIPYMTFYMPNDFTANQHYNFIPEQQQKQMISLYQSHQPQRTRVQQPQQPHHFQIRYPTQKPKYQAILYGTKHQITNQEKSPNEHQIFPISFKNSNIGKTRPFQQHSTPRVNLNPFVSSNKLPGQFTPIVYVHPTENVNYRKPQASRGSLKQYNEVLNEQQSYQHNGEDQSPVAVYTTPGPKAPILMSPSPTPLYPIINEVSQSQANQARQPVLVQHQQEYLTPQQKYVEYLKEQLRYKQQQYYQQHREPTVIMSASPAPPNIGNVLSYDRPEQIPINQIVFQPPTGSTAEGAEVDSFSPSPRPISYNHPSSPHPFEYNQSPTARPPIHNYPNYVEVIVQQPQQMVVSVPPEKQIDFKPVAFVTTPKPMVVSSVSPIYEHQTAKPFRPVEISNPIKPTETIEIPRPTEPKHPIHRPQFKIKPERRPTFVPKPISPPQTIRQHLTETTQVPLPTLTTYHPNFVSLKPKYEPSTASRRPYKAKIPQKFKPIIVQKPITQAKVQSKPTVNIPEDSFPNITHSSLTDILHKLQDSNQLPKTFTPENIDNSIRTLIKILHNLKESQTIVQNPPQHHEEDYDDYDNVPIVDPSHPSPNSGRPGIDYPAFAEIPHTNFNCKEQRYKGFFGDPETHCQVWHYCDLNGGQASFLCPNGTIFSQVALTCDWWFNVKCSSTAQLYVLNERLYKYILPLTPKFPEDYSGPLVDKYLALKFKEMEEKMRREKTKGKNKSEEKTEEEDEEEDEEEEEHEKNEDEIVHSTTQSSQNVEEQFQDTNENSIAPATSTTPSIPSLQSMPIVVTSTEEAFSKTPVSSKTSVESEKVEVIEIKTDGTSGHLIRPLIFNSGLKK